MGDRKQDIINADQTARLNTLFDILVDPAKRPNEEEIKLFKGQFEGGVLAADLVKNGAVESVNEKDRSLGSEQNQDSV
jgi:hypothetical protein